MAPDAFVGTASDYARHRPPYPDGFLADLRSVANTTGQGALLDLACGPGRVAIPMARYFRSVLAVDVEAEMIGVGKEEAAKRGATNITWRVEPAEDLELSDRSIELITVGEALHRLDQERTLTNALRWLQPARVLRNTRRRAGVARRRRVEASPRRGRQRMDGAFVADPNAGHWGGPDDALRAAGLESPIASGSSNGYGLRFDRWLHVLYVDRVASDAGRQGRPTSKRTCARRCSNMSRVTGSSRSSDSVSPLARRMAPLLELEKH